MILGTLLAQDNENGQEQAIYSLSRTMIKAEHKYNPMEKECLVLVFTKQKTRHYLLGQTTHVIAWVNPLRILMMPPGSLNSKLSKWGLLILQYDMKFILWKATKGNAIVDFLVDHLVLKVLGYMSHARQNSREQPPFQKIVCGKCSSMKLQE